MTGRHARGTIAPFLPVRRSMASFAAEPRELAATLASFRLCAVVGLAARVAFVVRGMRVDVPTVPLAGGIAALAAFALFSVWRLRQPWPVLPWEGVAHIGVDVAVLGWLLYWTGGAVNPFVSLLLIPTALAASALRLRHLVIVAGMSALTYLLLLRWHVPLPSLHVHEGSSDFSLHVLGMAVSFAISTLVLGYFIGRLARALRARREEVQHVRERALRDAGILAIATQAAGAAHELNTPLSTMQTLLAEMRREHPGGTIGEDVALLQSQVERCRESLRELVAVGKAQLADTRETTRLGDFVHDCLERFRLLRPEMEVALELDEQAAALALAVPYGLRHALITLLNTAADASEANGSVKLALTVQARADQLALQVRDQGAGTLPPEARGHTFV